MFKNIKQRLDNFFRADLRWKLIKLSKYTRVNFYPIFFSRKGFKGLYSRFIIHLLFREQVKLIKKNIRNDFFNYNAGKINFLISSPSSGSNFLRNMLQSYFELFYKIGNGVPKHDNINARFFFAGSQLNYADLWSQINIFNHLIDKSKFLDEKTYNQKKIVFTRYPLHRVDLYQLNQMKPVVLFRNPFEEISSVYIKYDRRPDDIRLKEVDLNLLSARMAVYEKYIKFWAKYAKEKEYKKDFLTINYDDLVQSSASILKKILVFYNYDIIEEYIEKSAFIHSRENTTKNLYGPKIYNRTRFINTEVKIKQKELIKVEFEKMLSMNKISEDFNFLKNISKQS